jgi:hypothetical protein
LIDPRPNQRNLRRRQRVAIFGHPLFVVQAEDAAHEQALLAVARDDGGAGFAAFHCRGAAI